MNREIDVFTQNNNQDTLINDPLSLHFQLFNLSHDNFILNQNEYLQYNYKHLLYNTNNQNIISPFHSFIPNLCQSSNIYAKQYVQKPRKKPIYRPHCKWTKEEDEKLKELIKDYGENDWRHLAKKFEGRNSRQCRERWNYYLNPRLKQGQWSIEEDQQILKKYDELGPRWMEISKYFESRTDAMIKNRYNYLIRKEKRQNQQNIINNNNLFRSKKCQNKSIYDIHHEEEADSNSDSEILEELSPAFPLETASYFFSSEDWPKFDETSIIYDFNETTNFEDYF